MLSLCYRATNTKTWIMCIISPRNEPVKYVLFSWRHVCANLGQSCISSTISVLCLDQVVFRAHVRAPICGRTKHNTRQTIDLVHRVYFQRKWLSLWPHTAEPIIARLPTKQPKPGMGSMRKSRTSKPGAWEEKETETENKKEEKEGERRKEES